MKRILYIEDEPLLGQIVQESLASRGFQLDWYKNGQDAAAAIKHASNYDLAILDVMLPGEDGLTIGKRLRAAFPHFPIVYLTALSQGKDVVAGFHAGANDYLRKPFSMEELIVRIENQLALHSDKTSISVEEPTVFKLGALSFNYHRLELKDDRTDVLLAELSHRQGELLLFFAARIGETIDRSTLLKAIWKDDSYFHSRNLDVYIRKLRQLLAADPSIRLLTLRGVGYRFLID